MAFKPLRISSDLNDLQNVEIDPTTELICAKGLDIANLGTHLVSNDGLGNMTFRDGFVTTPVTLTELLQDQGSRDFSYSFFGNNGVPYLEINSVNYVTIAELYFAGSNTLGPIDNITSIYGSNSATQTAEIRVFDLTNGLVIAEATQTSLARQIFNLGTISNVPTGPSIFEVQVKKTGGQARAQISSLTISTSGNGI